MNTDVSIIAEMGLLSDVVYNDNELNIDYFDKGYEFSVKGKRGQVALIAIPVIKFSIFRLKPLSLSTNIFWQISGHSGQRRFLCITCLVM